MKVASRLLFLRLYKYNQIQKKKFGDIFEMGIVTASIQSVGNAVLQSSKAFTALKR